MAVDQPRTSTFSLYQRLTLATLVLLLLFLGLSGLLLINAQQQSLEAEIRNRLLGHVYGLLGEAWEDAQGLLQLPQQAADPRLNQPDSGLQAELAEPNAGLIWRSSSLLGIETESMPFVPAGEQRFLRQAQGGYQLLFGLEWEGRDGRLRPYVLRIGLQADQVEPQFKRFQKRLWMGLLVLGLILLISQTLLLRWGLAPLRSIAQSVSDIEAGRAVRLEGDFPAELHLLTHNLNSLIQHNLAQQERFRTNLDDLAHSIKTPLALLQGGLDSGDAQALQEAARQAVPHIAGIVRGRLQRAAASGFSGIGQHLALHPLTERLLATLAKVYQDRHLELENRVPQKAAIPGDENDFMEILGNLLDNACKYARQRVRVSLGGDESSWLLQVEDDGSGIDSQQIEQVLARGGRLDEQHAGQGIGLAAVSNLVALYDGRLQISSSTELGGACLSIILPNRSVRKIT